MISSNDRPRGSAKKKGREKANAVMRADVLLAGTEFQLDQVVISLGVFTQKSSHFLFVGLPAEYPKHSQ